MYGYGYGCQLISLVYIHILVWVIISIADTFSVALFNHLDVAESWTIFDSFPTYADQDCCFGSMYANLYLYL